jgi:RNA polymerase sigma-70 factor (ECF subfamily)
MTKSVVEAPGESSAGQDSLERLAMRLQRREEGALEALIARTDKACFRLAYSILGDTELCKDALQEAYFLVYQRIGQLREPAAIKSWLYRIVSHCCHDIARRQGKEKQMDFSEREDLQALEQQPDPAEEIVRRQNLKATFASLPKIDRTAIALREVCGMSYEEMSRVLDIPLGTVRSRLAKARKRFVDLYKGARKP